MSQWFYENDFSLYAGTINLRGLDSAGNFTAPIITSSNILCSNLHAEFADNITGNISGITGPVIITDSKSRFNAKTGTCNVVVVQQSPILLSPNLGSASGTSINLSGAYTSTLATGMAPIIVASTTLVENLNVSDSLHSTWADTANVLV